MAKKRSRKKPNFDVRLHVLVPKHIKLNQKEKDELLSKYNLNYKQLPKISVNDPAIQTLNPKQGDIIKIIRQSPTAGESIYYRYVV
ncbi:MAG: DNA-directed RNA polymerase subunit H [Candidatus Woesearchaeota archaeon]